MFTIPANAQVFLCPEPISMRKSFEGLSALIEEMFPGEIFSGNFFIFLNRPSNYMKVLFWDGDGFVIWNKRLQRGRFAKIKGVNVINRRSFLMLFEGITPKKMQRRFRL